MGKRFEGEYPTFSTVVKAYQLLGIGHLLGAKGEDTAFTLGSSQLKETLEFHTVPGRFTAIEVGGLLRDAGLA